jgi:hypothetical protein
VGARSDADTHGANLRSRNQAVASKGQDIWQDLKAAPETRPPSVRIARQPGVEHRERPFANGLYGDSPRLKGGES